MAKEELSYEEILQVVELFKSSPELSEFHLRYGITELDLRKHGASETPSATNRILPLANKPDIPVRLNTSEIPAPVEITRPAAELDAAISALSKALPIKSITVGTFYCAPEPGATPFVTVGQRVEPNTTLCIIEVMKLMNSIQAGCSGVVSQILVKDGQAVEFGQTLIVIDQD